ncbi:survivin [Schizosaccharomyces japonicus yFS275]|uniref:Survivin n=1 Tax=Schizosaccharomyces japonicus (strain yFS275 / FY16936) TaxID=402676 RepID=B6K6S4_SCHJY|nr:survivin [Schizosaccharomyces japonicus yFS275]EEB09228.2 survivin [Schizosaccharomyces japonicus yFS275]
MDTGTSGRWTRARRNMCNVSARLLSFKKKKWPLKSPSPERLAAVGFYYKAPKKSSEIKDNVTCYMCNKSLYGWKPDDDPLKEHILHSPSCPWAYVLVARNNPQCNPQSKSLVKCRELTFVDKMWPYTNDSNHHCQPRVMAEAGFVYTPSSESKDVAHCLYCNIILYGWEPNDNPYDEHYKREPNCPFFVWKDPTRLSPRKLDMLSLTDAEDQQTDEDISGTSLLPYPQTPNQPLTPSTKLSTRKQPSHHVRGDITEDEAHTDVPNSTSPKKKGRNSPKKVVKTAIFKPVLPVFSDDNTDSDEEETAFLSKKKSRRKSSKSPTPQAAETSPSTNWRTSTPLTQQKHELRASSEHSKQSSVSEKDEAQPSPSSPSPSANRRHSSASIHETSPTNTAGRSSTKRHSSAFDLEEPLAKRQLAKTVETEKDDDADVDTEKDVHVSEPDEDPKQESEDDSENEQSIYNDTFDQSAGNMADSEHETTVLPTAPESDSSSDVLDEVSGDEQNNILEEERSDEEPRENTLADTTTDLVYEPELPASSSPLPNNDAELLTHATESDEIQDHVSGDEQRTDEKPSDADTNSLSQNAETTEGDVFEPNENTVPVEDDTDDIVLRESVNVTESLPQYTFNFESRRKTLSSMQQKLNDSPTKTRNSDSVALKNETKSSSPLRRLSSRINQVISRMTGSSIKEVETDAGVNPFLSEKVTTEDKISKNNEQATVSAIDEFNATENEYTDNSKHRNSSVLKRLSSTVDNYSDQLVVVKPSEEDNADHVNNSDHINESNIEEEQSTKTDDSHSEASPSEPALNFEKETLAPETESRELIRLSTHNELVSSQASELQLIPADADELLDQTEEDDREGSESSQGSSDDLAAQQLLLRDSSKPLVSPSLTRTVDALAESSFLAPQTPVRANRVQTFNLPNWENIDFSKLLDSPEDDGGHLLPYTPSEEELDMTVEQWIKYVYAKKAKLFEIECEQKIEWLLREGKRAEEFVRNLY